MPNILSVSGSQHFDEGITEGYSDSSDSEHSADQDSDSESQNVTVEALTTSICQGLVFEVVVLRSEPTRAGHHT
jgi:hypothetical protein